MPNFGIDWLTIIGGAMTVYVGPQSISKLLLGEPGPCCPNPLFLRLWTVYSFNWGGGLVVLVFYGPSTHFR